MKPMQTSLALLAAAAAGAAVTLLLDPQSGRRRRAHAWGALDHATVAASRGIGVATRDLQHRVHGVASLLRGVTATHDSDDHVVAARVGSRLGHASSHPHAIRVGCHEGVVELSGPILRDEAPHVLRVARGTFGVRSVNDRLERYTAPGDAPGLQGRPRAARAKPGYLSPAARLVVGGAGALATVAGAARGGAGGIAIALAGAAAIARSVANVPFVAMGGIAGHRPAIDVEKAITIHADIDRVFELFTQPEKLVRFMRRVTAIDRVGDARWHWKVMGTGGAPVEWDVIVDRIAPNELVTWKSAEGASVAHSGSARFELTAPRTTRLTIRLRFWPPAGLAGYDLARLLGDDPKRELDEDLLRLKSLLEQGKTTGPNGTVTLDEIRGAA